jgi:DNA-binding CsgD family transcriptional regulator
MPPPPVLPMPTPRPAVAPSDAVAVEAAWLELLDHLHDLVERHGPPGQAPAEAWREVFEGLARRIGATSVCLIERDLSRGPRDRRELVAMAPSGGQPGLRARRAAPPGFSPADERAFQAFAAHLHTALALHAALRHAHHTRLRLGAVWSALPAEGRVDDQAAVPPPHLADDLARRHGLTGREVALAWSIARGLSLKQHANLTGRSVETARAQLRSVFRKLGVSEQHRLGERVRALWQGLAWQPLGAHLAPPQPCPDTTVRCVDEAGG